MPRVPFPDDEAASDVDPLGLGLTSDVPAQAPAEGEVIDVVTTVGALDPVVVTLRELLHRSGAIRAVALLAGERDDDPPRLVDCARLSAIEVTSQGRTVHLPHALELDCEPLELYDVRLLPPFEVDPQDGRIAAPLGGVEHYGFAVRSLARALGSGAVALITFNTDTPEAPLSLIARGEEPIVLSLGEEEYEMEAGWPESPPGDNPPD